MSRVPPPVPMTAYASLSALGAGRSHVLQALELGVSKLAEASGSVPFPTWLGRIDDDLVGFGELLGAHDSRLARMVACLLAELDAPVAKALSRWGPARVGIFLGTSTAGISSTEAAWRAIKADGVRPESYDFKRQHAYGAIIEVARAITGVTGPGHVVSTACTSGAKVFASAQRLIAAGVIDAAIVGGIDTLCDVTLRGFHALGALSVKPCRPFSRERDGISIGEGGALALLERSGEARVRLLAVGETSDAHHVSAPHPEGAGAAMAMAAALALGGVDPRAIGHVNAHGTGTVLNDHAESRAIFDVLGPEVPVVSTKGYTGHTLGAAGALECILAAMALEEGWVPASLGAGPIDPDCHVNVQLSRSTSAARYALSNSLAFGGNNTSILLEMP